MSARDHPGGEGRPACKAYKLTAMSEPRRLITLWASTTCCRDISPFFNRFVSEIGQQEARGKKSTQITWSWLKNSLAVSRAAPGLLLPTYKRCRNGRPLHFIHKRALLRQEFLFRRETSGILHIFVGAASMAAQVEVDRSENGLSRRPQAEVRLGDLGGHRQK
jgi:hypothetical protein